jgi:glucokinase
MNNIVAGVDIGGTHITVCLIDITNGQSINESYTRAHIDTSLSTEKVISSWTEAIVLAHEKAGVKPAKIGIAMPGPFDYENGISYIKGLHKYESLYGLNVKNLLAEALGVNSENIKLINDASAYLLGELRAGAAKGFRKVVGVTLGTGLGSASYYDNTLYEGDLYCTDFENGKCEDFVSARWLLFEYQRLSGNRIDNVKEIADRCTHEKAAEQVFEKFGSNLFNVLYKRYHQQLPELVVIGGNIAKAWDKFIPSATKTMRQAGCHFEMKHAALGEQAALIGASYLWE